jgi:hypothetical protein
MYWQGNLRSILPREKEEGMRQGAEEAYPLSLIPYPRIGP